MAAYQQQEIQAVDSYVQPPAEIQENTTLLANGTAGQSKWQCCLKSNAALLILVWNFCIAFGLEFFSFYPVIPGLPDTWTNIMGLCLFGVSAIFLLFFPLAGYLADARWGRYRTILGSLRFFLISVLIIFFLGILVTCGSLAVVLTINSLGSIKIVSIIVLCLVFGFPILFGVFLIIFSLIAFSANVLQYGIDQLEYDARGENSVLYVYWYVWTGYMAEFFLKIMLTVSVRSFSIFINSLVFLIVLPIILGITFGVKQYSIQVDFVDTRPQIENPYKQIYQIIKFAISHENFTQHNQNKALPNSRFDLGKEQYGGPFKANQVEAVKSFLLVLCILLTLGPVLMADVAVSKLLPSLIPHMDRYNIYTPVMFANETYDLLKALIFSGALTPLIVVVGLPIYICLLRPCLYNYIPGALKRIGLGMMLIFLSALCTLIMDTTGHILAKRGNATVTTCFLNTDYIFDPYYRGYHYIIFPILNISSYVLTIQNILNAIGYMLIYISTFEFICAQSPQSVKGVLICSFYAIKGAFRLLGTLVLFAPFTQWNLPYAFPSCGFVYYLINTVLVLVGIVVFTIAANKCRHQGEIDNSYECNDNRD